MKKVLYVIIGLFAIYLILCIAGPSEVKVAKSISINAPKELVQKQMMDFKYFHDVWSPWTELDPAMKTTYTGEVGAPGYAYTWESPKDSVGKGSMTFEKVSNDTIFVKLAFDGRGESNLQYITKDSNNTTNVTWAMQFDVGFMGRAFMLFVNFDKMMAPYFEKGLLKLKTSLESMSSAPESPAYEIKEIQWEAKTFYGKKETVAFEKLHDFFMANFPKLGESLGKAKIEPIGHPQTLYYTYDEKTMTTECAAVMELPTDKKLDGWEKFETPAGKVLMIEYFGNYDKSGAAHFAMDAYMKKNNMTQSVVVEEYVTDPMVEKDTAKWQTNIYYLIK